MAHIVTLQRVNLPHTYIRNNANRFSVYKNSRESRNMLAIMANEHSIQTPCPLQQAQKSSHALTTDFHGNARTCQSQTAGLVMPTTCTTKRSGDLFVVTLVLCHIGGTPPRAPMTKVEYCTHQNGEPQASGTKIVRRNMQIMFTGCSEHIVVKSQLGTHPQDQMRDVQFSCAIKRVVPFRQNFRIAKPAGNHRGLAKELQCGRTLRQTRQIT